jgi:alpha-tubulin suppressor-like RCC1 family protein
VLGLTDVIALSNSGRFALRADGTVWAWGSNTSGELGNGTFTASTVPVRVTGLTDVVAIADAGGTVYALRADGTVWAWGSNYIGQLGRGYFGGESAFPVQVSGLTDVVAIGGGDGGLAIRADGTAWIWGANRNGQLADGQPCPSDPLARCMSLVPVRISGLAGVSAIVGGGNSYAVLDDGTVWAWGRSENGRLGNGVDCDLATQTCESRVPVRVSNLTNVSGVADFVDGGYALRADGTVWGWGSGSSGALGTGVTTYSTVPVHIAGLTGVSAVTGTFSGGFAVVPHP